MECDSCSLFISFHSHVHPDQRLSENDLQAVKTAVFPVRAKWYDFGVELKLPPSDLDAIREDFDQSDDCLREVLLMCLRSPTGLTWGAIVAALKQPTIGHDHLAAKVEKELLLFCL